MNRHVVGVDFGTLSGRAVVVRVDDGAELGSAVSEFRNAVIERALPATGERLPPSWALQDPDDYREVLRSAVPAAVAAAGVDPATVVGIGTDFTASTPLPVLRDGDAAVRAARVPRPAARLPEAVEAPRRAGAGRADHRARGGARRAVAAALRRADLVRVAVREGAAGAGGGPGDLRGGGALDRGRRLDRLAAVRRGDAQRVHRRLQGHPPGRRVPDRGLPRRARRALRRLRGGQARAPAVAARRARRRRSPPRRRAGPGCPRASPSRSATSTPTSPRPPRRRSSPARWWRSWAPRPATS